MAMIDYTKRDIDLLKDCVDEVLSPDSLLHRRRPLAFIAPRPSHIIDSEHVPNTSVAALSAPLLCSTFSAKDWDNQVRLRALAKSLSLKAGGTNEQIRGRIRAHTKGEKRIDNVELLNNAFPVSAVLKKRKRQVSADTRGTIGTMHTGMRVGTKVLLQQGYRVKQQFLGQKAIVSNDTLLPGGWYEVEIVQSDDTTMNGKRLLWRRSALLVQD
jgi:hypothetical protein